ncbi:hypothetical protein [Streptomyces sp. NPDC102462]
MSDESRTDHMAAAWSKLPFYQVTGCVLGSTGSQTSLRRKSDEEEE